MMLVDLELDRLMGSRCRVVAIEEGEGGGGGTPPPAADTIPKAEADRIIAQREREAARQAQKDLLAQFGDNVTADSIKAILSKQKADEDARKDEATRAREAADAEKAAAASERAAAKRELLAAKVERALLRANVKPDRLEMASKLIAVSDDADDDTIKAAAEAFKSSTPEWFPAPGMPPAPSGLPGTGQPPVQHPSMTGVQAGRERAKREREAASKRPAFGEGLTFIGGQAS